MLLRAMSSLANNQSGQLSGHGVDRHDHGFSISLLLAVIYRQLIGQRPC
jgi:hypothetical protein